MIDRITPDGLVRSENYSDTMENVVLPYLKARGTEELIPGDGGKALFTCRYIPEEGGRGTVFIVHGFTENAYKYSEVIYSLLKNGFCVFAYDQRGHGRSWKYEKMADDSLTHVRRFDEYEKDLSILCRAMEGKLPKPWSVFCHSMGGAVTALFLIRHGGVFSRAAMCAPMIALNRGKMPFFVSKLIARVFILAGKGASRLFISKPYSGRESFEGACSTGRERFEWYSGVKDSIPEFHNNGPSYSWMLESLQVTQKLLWPFAPKKIDCPVKIYSAEDDWEVMNIAQKMFVRKLRQGEIETVKGSRHEIYRSDDATLFPWWHDVLGFLKGQ